MAKTKYPKLPNGYGSISKLSGNRRNPYCVRPPVTEYTEDGVPIKPKPICYTDSWIHGFAALTAWKAGTYTPGCEASVDLSYGKNEKDLINRLLADYSRVTKRSDGMTFKQVYDIAIDWKISHDAITQGTIKGYRNSIKHCTPIYDVPLRDIRLADLQTLIDGLPLKSGSKHGVKNVIRLVYRYGISHDIISTDYSQDIKILRDETKHGRAFTEEEIKTLWEHYDDSDRIKLILVMIYTGFRISAYDSLEINLEEHYLKGGVKTQSGKNRVVPIHDAIYPTVVYLYKKYGDLSWHLSSSHTNRAFASECRRLGIEGVTPHSTRHTFATLAKRYRVPEDIRKMLMGHSVGNITDDVYTHLTPADLLVYVNQICW